MSNQIEIMKETLQEFNEKNEAKISEISKQFSEELKAIELENKALKAELEKTKTETFAEIDKAKVEAKKVVSFSQSNESVEYEMKKPICDAVSNIVKGEKISDSEFSKVAKGLEFALSKTNCCVVSSPHNALKTPSVVIDSPPCALFTKTAMASFAKGVILPGIFLDLKTNFSFSFSCLGKITKSALPSTIALLISISGLATNVIFA